MSERGMADMLAQAQQVQQRMAEMQRELAERRCRGEAGGGMVVAVATGQLRIVELHIEPHLIESGDREMLEDLTASAVNAALQAAQKMVQEEFQRLSGGLMMNLPGMPGAPGAPDTGS